MKRLLCPQLPKPHRPASLSEAEAGHAVRVLRLRDGDSVVAMDGQGNSTPAILRVHAGGVRLELPSGLEPGTVTAPPAAAQVIVPLILEMAVLKGDAMEWVVEKAVELGVKKLVPVLTAHTVVQMKNKGPEAFQERWQKIADQALKQCGRLERLEVELPTELELVVARNPATPATPRLWCDEAAREEVPALSEILSKYLGPDASEKTPTTLRLLIGPEGGWSEKERGMLAPSSDKTGLGPLVLRAETAALYGISLVVAAFRASNRLTKTRG